MDQVLILACDIGTSGVKTTLVQPDGTIFASEGSTYPTYSPHPGWNEQNPLDWWEGFCKSARKIFERFPRAAERVAAIGVSGHMLGCLPVNAQAEPLYNSMIHSDLRASQQYDRFTKAVGRDEVYKITGNILESRSTVCKILWLKENEPDIYDKTERFIQSKDFVVAKLTGNVDTTDYSDASHAQLINIRTGMYADYFNEVGIHTVKLPSVHKGVDIAGVLTPEAARLLGLRSGIPVAVGSGDGACANIGAGVVKPGDAYVCIGTTAWCARVNSAPLLDPSARLFNIVSADGSNCGVYGTVQSAGKTIQWVMELFGEKDVKELNKLVEDIVPGCEGLIFLPYLEGERSPVFDAAARGVFFGVGAAHRKGHFMRAAMEGVTMALRQVIDVFRETGSLNEIRAIGGGAKSEAWRCMLANIGLLDVVSLNVSAEDGTSLGAAVIAGTAAGIFPSIEEGVKPVRIQERIRWDMLQARLYEQAYKTYVQLYPALRPIFPR